jgi:ElaB/YqjD/DUF883 family membrane-anchored ribosome-binding protein
MSKKADMDDIEDRLSNNRAALTETLTEIFAKVGPTLLLERGVDHLRDNADVYALKAQQTVQRNPLAFALMGAGLAWLVLGNRGSDHTDHTGDLKAKVRDVAEDVSDGVDAVADRWAKRLDNLRKTASEKVAALEEESAKGLDDARDFTAEKASILAEFAEATKEHLADGLETLSAGARRKVIAAREAAYAARLNAEAAAKSTGHETARFVQDHPLVTAALGIGIGAAIAAAVPHVRARAEKSSKDDLGHRLAAVLAEEAEATLRKLGSKHRKNGRAST